MVAASFDLSGEGPHAINVQLVSDPARTATVPIVGSRAAERSRTVSGAARADRGAAARFPGAYRCSTFSSP